MPTEVLDAQLHVWEPDRPGRPWSAAPYPTPTEPAPFVEGTSVHPAEAVLESMAELDIDGAVLVTSARHYGFDNSYAIESARRHPDKFRVVARIDGADPAVGDTIAEAAQDPMIVGVRLLTMAEPDRVRFREGGFDHVFAAAQSTGVALNIYPIDTLPLVADAARRYPELQFVIDHLGLAQRPLADIGSEPFAQLPELLACAAQPNVAVKLSGVATLSWQPFPYAEVWPHVHELLTAFGPERVMWGSDATRAEGVATYEQGLRWLTDAGELGEPELELLLGQALRRVYRWH